METIHEGDVSPRMFEVLSDLQRTLLDIIKSQTMYMIAIEENAKKISRDVDVYHNTEHGSSSNKQSGIKARGTKDLMRALQDTINEEEITDVDGNENEE
jgi:predicted transcriptional regulator